MGNESEVARIRAQIEAEHQAAKLALHGLQVGTARHAFIEARTERIGALHESLVPLIGQQEAIHLLCEIMEGRELPRPI
ncbi:MAG: hypothetical protein J2P37_31250 [Ktedonobacteraceae bacterium]|nr:hypothetical protein [Ktedonobacteraceae bacterium]